MDNWVIFLLVNVVLALTVSIFGNFATGWVKAAYDKSVFSSRKKRIETLITEYKVTKALRGNPQLLTNFMLNDMATGFYQLCILITQVGIDVLIYPYLFDGKDITRLWSILLMLAVLYFITYTANRPFSRVGDRFHNALVFDTYTEETIAKIKKLGGNLEDLDKEETA